MRKNKDWGLIIMLLVGTVFFVVAALFLAVGTDEYGNLVYKPEARLTFAILAIGSAIATILMFRGNKK